MPVFLFNSNLGGGNAKQCIDDVNYHCTNYNRKRKVAHYNKTGESNTSEQYRVYDTSQDGRRWQSTTLNVTVEHTTKKNMTCLHERLTCTHNTITPPTVSATGSQSALGIR